MITGLFSVLTVVLAAASGALFYWGIGIAAIIWYRRQRTAGRLLFMAGWWLGFVPGLARIVPVFLAIQGLHSSQPGSHLFVQIVSWIFWLVALAGFALVVLSEERASAAHLDNA